MTILPEEKPNITGVDNEETSCLNCINYRLMDEGNPLPEGVEIEGFCGLAPHLFSSLSAVITEDTEELMSFAENCDKFLSKEEPVNVINDTIANIQLSLDNIASMQVGTNEKIYAMFQNLDVRLKNIESKKTFAEKLLTPFNNFCSFVASWLPN